MTISFSQFKMDQIRLLAVACTLFSINGQTKSEANYLCDQRNCSFLLSNQKEAQEQFHSIDHKNVWLVYLKIQITNDSSPSGNNKPLILAWTKSEDSPFLTFDSNFEIYSFSLLTAAVKLIKLQAKSVGPNSSSDCLKRSSLLCRNKTISKAILRTLTNKKGVVCFGESPSRCCCKYSHEDVKCGIRPEDRWRWLDGSVYLTVLFVIVGNNFLSLLVYLLPSLPTPRNGIEVTSLLDPSPLSFSNILSNCFNNKPVHCFRDAFIIFCCRTTVLLGILPSGLYLSAITFRALNHNVCFVSEHPSFFFRGVDISEEFYIVFAVYAFAVSLFPILQYRYLFQTSDFQYRFYLYCLLANFGFSADFLKSYVKRFAAYFSLSLWYSLPFCCQDKRNIRKPCNMPTWLYFVLSPFIFLFFLSILFSLLLFPSYVFYINPTFTCMRRLDFIPKHTIHKILFLSFLMLALMIASAQLAVTISNTITLSQFATYTTIGFVLSYKLYLSFLSGIILVVLYVYQCYRSTNESFDELRTTLFEVCTKMQIEKQEQSQDEELQPLSASQPLRQLIYIDEENGSRLIPKELYANICWELKPVGIAFLVLTIKVCAVILFVVALLSVVLTLTPRSEFGNVAQAALTLLVGALPKVFTMFSRNSSKEKQQIMETKSRIRHYVKKYLENGALSEEEFLEAKTNKSDKQHINLINRFTKHVSGIEAKRPREDSWLITL